MNELSQNDTVVKLYHLPTLKAVIIFIILVLFLGIVLVFTSHSIAFFVFLISTFIFWFILPVVVLGKIIEFTSINIKITYLLPFRTMQEIKYEDIIGFNRWTYSSSRGIPFTRMEEICVFLKNGRIIRVEDYIASKSIIKFKSYLDSHNILKLGNDAPTFNFSQPYL